MRELIVIAHLAVAPPSDLSMCHTEQDCSTQTATRVHPFMMRGYGSSVRG